MKMHFPRIVDLGLAIGALLNVFGVLGNGLLLPVAWAKAIPVRPEQAMTGSLGVVISFLSDFIFGPTLVWLYAAMTPRFGANFATAMRAALVIWVLGVAVPYLGIVRIGWLPIGVVLGTCAVAFVSFIPAAWLVKHFYKEPDNALTV